MKDAVFSTKKIIEIKSKPKPLENRYILDQQIKKKKQKKIFKRTFLVKY